MFKKYKSFIFALIVFAFVFTPFSRTNAALPAPNHPMDFGYYFTDGKEGDFRAETNCYTNLYYAWPYRNYVIGQWKSELAQSLSDAVRDHRHIQLNLGQETTNSYSIDEILTVAAPYWSGVVRIELADEPSWTRRQTAQRIQALRDNLTGRHLADVPIGIVYAPTQLDANVFSAAGLDWIGIEAYVDPPGSSDSQANITKLTNYVNQAKSLVPSTKKIVLVMQAYARNGGWTNIQTLTDLQIPTYMLAYNDPRVISLNMFSYGRASGTHDHMELSVPHKEMGAAMGMVCANATGTPAPGSSETPSPSSSPTPSPTTINCPDTENFVCGVDGSTYLNQCYADSYGVSVAHEGVCSDFVTPSPPPEQTSVSLSQSVRKIGSTTSPDTAVSVAPGDTVEFISSINTQGSGLLDNLIFSNVLPQELKYKGNLVIDGQPSDQDPSSGVNLSGFAAGTSHIISFQATVDASSFNDGVTTLTNTANLLYGNISGVAQTFINVSLDNKIISGSFLGRDLTKGTNEAAQVKANPNDTIRLTTRLSSLLSTPLTNVGFRVNLPQGIDLIPGSLTIDGVSSSENPVQGTIIDSIPTNRSKEISLQVKLRSSSFFSTGVMPVIPSVAIHVNDSTNLSLQMPIIVSNPSIGSIGQVSTGGSVGVYVIVIAGLFSISIFAIYMKFHLSRKPYEGV